MPSQVGPLLRTSEDREVLQLKNKVGKPGLRIVVADTMRESKKVIITTSRARVDPSATKDLLDKDQVHQRSQARILIVMSKGGEEMIVAVAVMTDPRTKIVEVVITAVMVVGTCLLQAINQDTIGTTKGNPVIKEGIVAEATKDVESFLV
jgi:hypothetical protein